MTSVLLSVFLLAVLHASSAWDTSNIWFPDPNNPVFYNMTFYQEAKKAVQRAPQSPPQPPRVEESVPVYTEPEKTIPTWSRTQQQGVKRNRVSAQEREDNRNTGSVQDDRIEYSKPVPSEVNSGLRDMFNRNRKPSRQPSSNRLQRRDYEDQVGFRNTRDEEYQPEALQDSDIRGTNTQQWRNRAPAGNEASNTVEGDIISAIETTSTSSRPSKCVWAIISCCKPTSPEIRYMCFEALGCHGAFWDNNPCSKEMTLAAVQATASFYNLPITDE